MVGWLSAVLGENELLMQFLSGADPSVDDRDVRVGTKTAHPNHLSRQIIDSNPLTHLKHENVGPARKARGLDDQAGGLGNVHEIAGHAGMGHRYRAALVYLLSEFPHHASSPPPAASKPDPPTPTPTPRTPTC